MAEVARLKKYANRRLYDTENSTYVTLSEVAEMIKSGRMVEVVDEKTKEDVTACILTQIIFEEAKKTMSGLAKTAKYVMSHTNGKIEICGVDENNIYLKYVQAKNTDEVGKFLVKKIPKDKESYWFDDLED